MYGYAYVPTYVYIGNKYKK